MKLIDDVISLGVCLIHPLAITVPSTTNVPYMETKISHPLPLNQKHLKVQSFFANENPMSACVSSICIYTILS